MISVGWDQILRFPQDDTVGKEPPRACPITIEGSNHKVGMIREET
jgi:hypothetical protein